MEDQPNVTRRKPSRFRPLHSFSLRTLFLAMTILAVQCAVCLPALRQWQRIQRSKPQTFTRGLFRYTIRNIRFIGEKEIRDSEGFL